MSEKTLDTNANLTDTADFKHAIANRAMELKGYVADSLKEGSHKVKAKALEANHTVVGYVKENPWKAVGIGVAVGLALGKLFQLRK